MIVTEINENINILSKQISNIKEIILTSSLEILPKDILTEEEIKENNITVEMLPYIKSCVLNKENLVIFVLSIPNFVKNSYFKIIIEKIPNKDNSLEINTETNKVIACENNIFVNLDKKQILKKELIMYDDQCISNLLNT